MVFNNQLSHMQLIISILAFLYVTLIQFTIFIQLTKKIRKIYDNLFLSFIIIMNENIFFLLLLHINNFIIFQYNLIFFEFIKFNSVIFSYKISIFFIKLY
jgi:hypothetical protein